MNVKLKIVLTSFLLFFIICITGGCSKTDTKKDSSDSGSNNQSEVETGGFLFEYQGVTIPMHAKADNIIKALGESMDYFEAPSCAFQGLDKIFYYSGFELSTYPKEDIDYVSAVNFTDDSVSTKEGISIGSSSEDVIKAYGSNYTSENGSYIYTLGKSKLSFITEEDTVTAITYEAIND